MKTSWTLCEGPFETLYPRVERCNRILGGSTTRKCCEPGLENAVRPSSAMSLTAETGSRSIAARLPDSTTATGKAPTTATIMETAPSSPREMVDQLSRDHQAVTSIPSCGFSLVTAWTNHAAWSRT
jgi:hypothetical protein